MPLPRSLDPLVSRLVEEGAQVVWLAGSYATGGAGPYSDVDLGVLAAHPAAMRLEAVEGYLVSISTTTEAATRASFRAPTLAGAAVSGWREAELLHDPEALGQALTADAQAWSWDFIAAECDAWVAAEVTRLADQALKLLNAHARADPVEAAFRAVTLSGRLALVMSVCRRLLYGSERNLFSMVADVMGRDWQLAFQRALRSHPLALETSSACALWLYRVAAREVQPYFDPAQRAVVELAVRDIGAWEPLERLTPS
jgi:hypothetical protein